MLEGIQLTNGLAAFLVGLLSSPHCLLMCGPLSCGLLGGVGMAPERRLVGQSAYHLSRVLAYGCVGAVAGTLGYAFTLTTAWNLQPLVPWVLVGLLLVYALQLHARLPRPRCLGQFATQISLRARGWSVPLKGVALGAVTPFLPCGPLYAVFWVAMMAGSPELGAELGLAFGLGTVPLLWLGQQGWLRVGAKISPRAIRVFQRSIAGIAASVIALKMLEFDSRKFLEMCGF